MTTSKSLLSLLIASATLAGCSAKQDSATVTIDSNANVEKTVAANTSPLATDLNINNVRAHIAKLASDEFEGRGPLSAGETLTINYLKDQYQAAGLQGGVNGKFLQKVAMAKLTPDQSMVLNIAGMDFTAGVDFTARTKQLVPQIQLNDSDMVYVGYGITAPEYNWNDYDGIDVKGKTVVLLVNDPGFATQDDTLFTGNAMTYYGRWSYKYEEAARQGAKAVLVIHETAEAAYPWSVVDSSNSGAKFSLMNDNNNMDTLPILCWLSFDAAKKVFKAAGLNYLEQKKHALDKNFKAIDLNITANLTLDNAIDKAESHNVVALLPGSEQADEYIVVGAHWDHFGKKETDTGTKIYNGAVDNATGVAATLELARMMAERAKTAPLKRSLLFVNFTAEETGLIGSKMFAAGTVVPSKQIVGILNIDGMNPLDGVDYILQYGKDMSEMEQYLADAAKAQGRHVKMDPRPQNGLFFRSDHFPMAQQGVPGLLFMSLGDTDPDYITHKYHKEADDYSADWSMGGVEQDMQLILSIANKLGNNDDWPKWTSESDFKTRRQQDREQ